MSARLLFRIRAVTLAMRVEIVLLAAEGRQNRPIEEESGIDRGTVVDWVAQGCPAEDRPDSSNARYVGISVKRYTRMWVEGLCAAGARGAARHKEAVTGPPE